MLHNMSMCNTASTNTTLTLFHILLWKVTGRHQNEPLKSVSWTAQHTKRQGQKRNMPDTQVLVCCVCFVSLSFVQRNIHHVVIPTRWTYHTSVDQYSYWALFTTSFKDSPAVLAEKRKSGNGLFALTVLQSVPCWLTFLIHWKVVHIGLIHWI